MESMDIEHEVEPTKRSESTNGTLGSQVKRIHRNRKIKKITKHNC